MKNSHILVLGADGLVGQTVFSYLQRAFPTSVWGTTRNKQRKKDVFPFSVRTAKKDIQTILKHSTHLDFIINCIGITDASQKKAMQQVNAAFPHLLEKITDKTNTKIVHISTDAVFSPLAGVVTEQDTPIPVTTYGKAKLEGETSMLHALTIRTSFLGPDKLQKRGFLEKVLQSAFFDGYTNQTWSGCTTLQFAEFCTQIITTDIFEKIRDLSSVIHFVPLHSTTKYQLAKAIVNSYERKDIVIKKVQGEPITRSLDTLFFDELALHRYTQQITTAIRELKDL